MRPWDGIMFGLIMYTAIVTPFEIAFLNTKLDTLFVVNRIVDLFFVGDIVINFILAYYNPKDHMVQRTFPVSFIFCFWLLHAHEFCFAMFMQWVTDLKLIAHRYLTSWFIVDIVSIFPFDAIALTMDVNSGSTSVAKLRMVRMIRLMRLIKLLRIMRVIPPLPSLPFTASLPFHGWLL